MKQNLVRFLTFAAALGAWPYLAIFASDLGISDLGIGLIVSCFSLALFLSSYIFGRASDRFGRRLFLLVGLAVTSISFLLQILAQGFVTLLVIRTLVGFCLGIYPAALIAYVHENKHNMSEFSAFGSLGWTLGALVAGSIAMHFSIRDVFISSSLIFFLAFLVASKMKFGHHSPIDVPTFPIEIIKKNLPLYLSILVRHSGAHMIWTFWSLYLRMLGADLFWIGIIQMVNSLTQFIFMYTLSRRIGYVHSISFGLLMSGATFFLLTFASDHWQTIPFQILLGISWAFLYVGALRYLMDRNVEKATVSGLFDSVLSLSSIIGPFMATAIVTFGGYKTTFYSAALCAFVGFFLFRLSNRI